MVGLQMLDILYPPEALQIERPSANVYVYVYHEDRQKFHDKDRH